MAYMEDALEESYDDDGGSSRGEAGGSAGAGGRGLGWDEGGEVSLLPMERSKDIVRDLER